MPKDPQSVVTDYTYTQNRELSWLRFNRRVLEEGADETVPALERLKFIAIFASNLDEFFMVRVGSLVDMAAVSPEEVDSKSGMRPREQLKAVYEAVPGLIEIKGQLYNRVSGLLAQEGIVDLTYDQLTQEERAQVKDYFHSVVLPILSPQIVGQRHPTPHLDNKALYITALLRSKSGKTSLGFIPLPTSLPPLFLLPGTRGRFLRLETHQIYYDSAPLSMGYVYDLEKALSPDLRARLTYPAYHPRWPEDLNRQESMIEQIRRKDRLLFFPFDSIDPFLRLLEEAADRPDVASIKITIYRLASTSKIARILCRAAENGKEVVALMELRARFDEANNIAWSKMLEEAGCKVIYGMENFKCHSKLCLITLRDKKGTHYITQVGTGNYNEKTSALYTDLSVMTASPVIGDDGAAFFRNMLTDNLEGGYHSLLVAPNGLKSQLCTMIQQEIDKGPQGYLCIKANSITEREIIDKLREASQAGVQIEMIIRGICCIRPGVLLKTENIQVTSIVGRYLEHARIYVFGRGDQAKYFIASADLMTRNLQRRVEIACPIWDREIQEQLRYILDLQLQDNAKASFLQPSGAYLRKEIRTVRVDSQEELMRVSLHRPEQAPAVSEKPSALHRLLGRLFGKDSP